MLEPITLNKRDQRYLDRLLDGQHKEMLDDLVWSNNTFLTRIEEEVDWVDTYQYEKHQVFKCINGKYYELRYVKDNYRGERNSLEFYEVVPKEITKIVYERKEN
jgi:hypothetical protein